MGAGDRKTAEAAGAIFCGALSSLRMTTSPSAGLSFTLRCWRQTHARTNGGSWQRFSMLTVMSFWEAAWGS
eukprot:3928439-Amphidinium_carterae.1